MKIAICILTYKRDAQLGRLLKSLAELEKPIKVRLEIIVVDNYGLGEASQVVRELRESPWPITYVVQKERGIAQARNRALESVPDDCEYVAFLDDDEWVPNDWLMRYIEGISKYRGSVWVGHVKEVYPSSAPGWIHSRWLSRRPPSEGSSMRTANTGNVLFRKDILEGLDFWFDNRYGISGGEDSDFFYRVHLSGREIVGVPRAVAFEDVDVARLKVGWFLKRNLRSANTNALSLLSRHGVKARILLSVYAVARCCVALFIAPLLVFAIFDFAIAVRVFIYCSRLIGSVMGLFNFRYMEYRDV